MQQKLDTRLHPINAFRAMRKLMQNREDTGQVFLLNEALRGKTTLRQIAKFRRTEVGKVALADHRRLLDRLNDRETLAALPAGTLGRAYYEFMQAENLSADGLVEASKTLKSWRIDDDVTWFRERNREMHDLLHIVTGYGRDPLGEASLVAFSFAQTWLKGFLVIAITASLRLSQAVPDQPMKRAVFEGWRRGRRAKWLIAADWEALLSQPIEAIRDQFEVRPSSYYPKIISAIRERRTTTGQAYPAPALTA
jgi:ubiquinone biosynthesis protein COQ4